MNPSSCRNCPWFSPDAGICWAAAHWGEPIELLEKCPRRYESQKKLMAEMETKQG